MGAYCKCVCAVVPCDRLASYLDCAPSLKPSVPDINMIYLTGWTFMTRTIQLKYRSSSIWNLKWPSTLNALLSCQHRQGVSPVSSQMLFEAVGLSERPSTHRTPVWLFTCMNSQVKFKVSWCRESFATGGAAVRFLSGVQ